jgi:hypothetical protein
VTGSFEEVGGVFGSHFEKEPVYKSENNEEDDNSSDDSTLIRALFIHCYLSRILRDTPAISSGCSISSDLFGLHYRYV